jgi:2-dehydropantoate 2-reductase
MNERKNKGTGEVLVIGAGAIGGTIGAILKKANVDVCFVNRKGDHYNAIKKTGLVIEGFEKPFKIPIKSNISDLDRKFQHILIAVKNMDTEKVMKDIQSVLLPNSLVYSLQNGFGNTDIMAKYVPREQIVAGVVGWGASKPDPGRIKITSKTGEFILGFEEGNGINDLRLKEMKNLLDLWRPTILTNNIVGHRWSKLVINSVITPVSALFDLTIGELLRHKVISKIMGDMKRETIHIAKANGIKLEKVDNINVRSFLYKPKPDDNLITRIKFGLISKFVKQVSIKRHGEIKSSLLWDLRNGRKTEIDFINGYIVKKAKEQGLEAPLNSFCQIAVKEMENKKRNPGMANLQEIIEISGISREKVKEQELK